MVKIEFLPSPLPFDQISFPRRRPRRCPFVRSPGANGSPPPTRRLCAHAVDNGAVSPSAVWFVLKWCPSTKRESSPAGQRLERM